MALRLLANLAALVALAALGLALGDFASHPNPLGAVGLVVMVVVISAAFVRLYRPGGLASRRPAPAPAPEPAREEPPAAGGAGPRSRRRSSQRPTSAPLWLDDDR